MTRRSPVPSSLAFEGTARGAKFRDRIAVVAKASPETTFRALHEVTRRDMKFAWLLGELLARPMLSQRHGWVSLSESIFFATMLWVAVLAVSFLRVQARASIWPIATNAAGSARL